MGTRPAIDTGVVYMRVANSGPAADRLDDARSGIARAVELHRSSAGSASMDGMKMSAVMSMERVASVTIPAHGSVTFGPGGYHVMAIGLRARFACRRTLRAAAAFCGGRLGNRHGRGAAGMIAPLTFMADAVSLTAPETAAGGGLTQQQIVLDAVVFILGVVILGGLLYIIGRRIFREDKD